MQIITYHLFIYQIHLLYAFPSLWFSVHLSNINRRLAIFCHSPIFTAHGILNSIVSSLVLRDVQELKLLLALWCLLMVVGVGLSIANIDSIVVLLSGRMVDHLWILLNLLRFFQCDYIFIEPGIFRWNHGWSSNVIVKPCFILVHKIALGFAVMRHLGDSRQFTQATLWSRFFYDFLPTKIFERLIILWNVNFLNIWLEHSSLFVCHLFLMVSVILVVYGRISVVVTFVWIRPLKASASTSALVSILTYKDVIVVNGVSHLSFFNHSIGALISKVLRWFHGTSCGSSGSLIVLKEVAYLRLRICRELANRCHILVMLLVRMVLLVLVIVVGLVVVIMLSWMIASVTLWSHLTRVRRSGGVGMASIRCLGKVLVSTLVVRLHCSCRCVHVAHLVLIIHCLRRFCVVSLAKLTGYR